ncbi:GFA family protein [Photobacterium atrarenae]|uniref:GFA family protein n=1 Tax=Photobacterium atrarenae TaxID=865757 RepID=A0ABY5GL93_9GAMM|nr:GFA family protein [Photobacterium atrarenae]UTV29500.1 GFA family protein [Photobacterium atrarenae]
MMEQHQAVSGSCLCGKVTLKAEQADLHVGACHCGMCRKWGGGPYLAVEAGDQVTIDGEAFVSRFASSEWAERGFCSVCGTHLFYRLKDKNQYIVPAGLLDQQDKLVMSHQIFIDKKPEYYAFSNSTENMTEAEVFAKYAP